MILILFLILDIAAEAIVTISYTLGNYIGKIMKKIIFQIKILYFVFYIKKKMLFDIQIQCSKYK